MVNREYFNNRRKERRKKFFDILGGKCQICGSKENLQFDHRDPKTKSFNISEQIDTNINKLLKELNKCDLLCAKHHRVKTKMNEDFSLPATQHGSLRMYIHYGCRCKLCKQKISDYYYSRRS